MRWLDHMSLVSGPLPWSIALGALIAALWLLAHATRRAQLSTPVAIAGSVLALAGVSAWLDLPRVLHGTYPMSFLVWFALPLAAGVVTAMSARRLRVRGLAIGAVAVMLLGAFAADRVDAFYGYLPSVGDLLGAPLPGQVAVAPALVGAGVVTQVPTVGAVALPSLGVLAPLDIPDTVSHFSARTAWIWLPPVWFDRRHPVLPALELLSGTPGTTTDWLRGGQALVTLNDFARAHDGWGPVVVFADENGSLTSDTECVDTPSARADTYLTVDVVRELRARFGVSTAPRHWIVAGLSEGGTCAIVLALRHPRLYSGFGDYSGDPAPNLVAGHTLQTLFDGSVRAQEVADPRWNLTHHHYDGLHAAFVIGSKDDPRLIDAMRQLSALADRAGATASFNEISGSHTFYVWADALRLTLAWLLAPFAPRLASAT
jgi:hypothetical protein